MPIFTDRRRTMMILRTYACVRVLLYLKCNLLEVLGTPDRIRTCDLELRSLLLCPAELPGLMLIGAGGESRTPVSSLEG